MTFFWLVFNIIFNVNSLTFVTQSSCTGVTGNNPCIYGNANMFDISATGGKDIRISGLKIKCKIGLKTVLVYRNMPSGGYSSHITDSTQWALEAERQVDCNGFDIWTDIGGLNIFIHDGDRIGFLIHIPSFTGPLVYTDEDDRNNADITVYDGLGIDYSSNPFGFNFTSNDYATRIMPNIEVSYEIADNFISTNLSPTNPVYYPGIMFEIVTKSNPVRIKSFDIQCGNPGSSSVKIYARTTYAGINLLESKWMTILDTTVSCPVNGGTINVGRLTNDVYIPPLTIYGFYIDVSTTYDLRSYQRTSDITGNDFNIRPGIIITGNQWTGVYFSYYIFSGRIYYEIVYCYLSQVISRDGTYTLTSMTTENPNTEGNNAFTFIYGTTNYLCITIGASYTCQNPRITASLVDNDYNDNGESFEMSIVVGLTNVYNLIWKHDFGTQGNCNNRVSPPTPIAFIDNSSLTSSNGQIVIALKNDYAVNNVCFSEGFSPEQSQSMNVDVTISCFPPTKTPTESPTLVPTTPTHSPTQSPTKSTPSPTPFPTNSPTTVPTDFPTTTPTDFLSSTPTNLPTISPTIGPSNNPTLKPNTNLTTVPTKSLGNDNKQENIALFVGLGIGLGIGLIFTGVACIFCVCYLQHKGQTNQVSHLSHDIANDPAQLGSISSTHTTGTVALTLSNLTQSNENIHSNDNTIADQFQKNQNDLYGLTKGDIKPHEFVTKNGQNIKEGES